MKGRVIRQATPPKNKKPTKSTNSEVSRTPSNKRAISYAPLKQNDIIGISYAEAFQHRAFELQEPEADADSTADPKEGEEHQQQSAGQTAQQPKRKVTVSPDVEIVASTATLSESATELKPAHMRPTKEWKETQLVGFFDIRDRISVLRHQFVAHNCTKQLEPAFAGDVKEWKSFCINHQPLLSTILRLNQRTLSQLIGSICEWLETEEQNIATAEQLPSTSKPAAVAAFTTSSDKQPKSFAECCHLDLANNCHWLGSWLYAALTCLQMPLEPYLHNTLRKIARIFIRLRSQLQDEEIEKAVPYNLFIYLIVNVFGQLDFEDEV